jgi:predicted ABC-type ATPase
MKTIYLLAGCNGAGKTTAAFTLLPGLLACRLAASSLIVQSN